MQHELKADVTTTNTYISWWQICLQVTISSNKGPQNSSTKGPQDSSTKGPQDSSTKGPQDSSTKGPQDSSTKGPQNSSTKGPQNSSTKGPQNCSTKGPQNSSCWCQCETIPCTAFERVQHGALISESYHFAIKILLHTCSEVQCPPVDLHAQVDTTKQVCAACINIVLLCENVVFVVPEREGGGGILSDIYGRNHSTRFLLHLDILFTNQIMHFSKAIAH